MTPDTRRQLQGVTHSPQVTRLNLAALMHANKPRLSYSAAARAAGISRSALYAMAVHGSWPRRSDPAALRQKVLAYLESCGVEVQDLATAFDPVSGDTATTSQPRFSQPTRRPAGDESTFEELDMLLPKQALTPQARRHFKLFTNPFDGEVVNDSMMFTGDDVAYVREACWQCSQTGGFTAIVGESGAGKTTMLLDLEARLDRETRGVVLIKPSVLGMEENDITGKTLKSADILHAIITTLDGASNVPQTLQARTLRAQKLLTSSAQAGNTHLLVIEEAHSMPDPAMRHLKRLHEQRSGRKPLLGILLLAQPELKQRLARGLASGALREVAQRLEIVELLPLDSDLKSYLTTRADAANVALSKLIDDSGIEEIRSRLMRRMGKGAISMCYPLAVNNLVTKALNEAAELGVPVVSRDVIQAV